MEIQIIPGEWWWGGHSALGHEMPYGCDTSRSIRLEGNTEGNQSQPAFLSSLGRLIWSEKPFAARFEKGRIEITDEGAEVVLEQTGTTLRDAHSAFVGRHCRFDGRLPESGLFAKPQFNTWIELTYDQREDRILDYAEGIVRAGYEPGVLMIDDNWQEDYGTWEFSRERFRNPKDMVRRLHDLGFVVVLWICPFVSPDSATARDLAQKGLLIREKTNSGDVLWSVTNRHPAIVRWWNGASAVLDFGNPAAITWFRCQLDRLRSHYGVDGFKFDAGDADFYSGPLASYREDWGPNDHTHAFASLASEYSWSELRACWKLGGYPVAQRLRDKRHAWEDLRLLIPQMGLLGLLGHPFSCPDLIGGGEYQSFLRLESLDQELVVRWAQCSALMPMMQFSAAPWRALDSRNAALCLAAAKLHTSFAPRILELARAAAKTGDPILRLMIWQYPEMPGAAEISDQFMLGPDLLVAPVLEAGLARRRVILPPGTWTGDRGETFVGPGPVVVESPLDRLPYFQLNPS